MVEPDAVIHDSLSSKVFPFLTLPREIRDLIYEAIFNDQPTPRDHLDINWTEFYSYRSQARSHSELSKLNHSFNCSLINVQLTCRQVYKEANPVFYGNLHVNLEITSCDHAEGAEELLGRRHLHYRSHVERLRTDESGDCGHLEYFSNLKVALFSRITVWDITVRSFADLLGQITKPESGENSTFYSVLQGAYTDCHQAGIECWFELNHELIDETKESAPHDDSDDDEDTGDAGARPLRATTVSNGVIGQC
jgi:hypothetical protein